MNICKSLSGHIYIFDDINQQGCIVLYAETEHRLPYVEAYSLTKDEILYRSPPLEDYTPTSAEILTILEKANRLLIVSEEKDDPKRYKQKDDARYYEDLIKGLLDEISREYTL